MKHRSSFSPISPRRARRNAFTLVELLVVLAIIGLLAAILFPAFKRAREGGYQASCAANLKQIYQAVQLYRQDEKAYPASLAVLLANDASLGNPAGTTTNIPMSPPATTAGPACDTAAKTCPNPDGTGYLKGGRDALVCTDDDTGAAFPRSSYGDISTQLDTTTGTDDMGRYLWNYWGYQKINGATCTATGTDFHECAGTAFTTSTDAATAGNADKSLLVDSSATAVYDLRKNPIKYSMSNRYAPTGTIITHCIYHRLPTASGKLSSPEIYDPANTTAGAGARDIVLRLDGSARVLDVSNFTSNGNWQKQNW